MQKVKMMESNLYENIQIYSCGEINKLQKKRKRSLLMRAPGIFLQSMHIYIPRGFL